VPLDSLQDFTQNLEIVFRRNNGPVEPFLQVMGRKPPRINNSRLASC
jgi:hypothetical protein